LSEINAGDVSIAKNLLETKDAEVLHLAKVVIDENLTDGFQGNAVPRVNTLHISAIQGNTELLSILTNRSNVNSKDQVNNPSASLII
jgi:hypothetical protein